MSDNGRLTILQPFYRLIADNTTLR